MGQITTDSNKGTKVFGGNNGFLILSEGKLYGIGDNYYKQISKSGSSEITSPCLIAENVVSAAVGNCETAYVTADGEVVLFGNGKYAKGFKGFGNATQILFDCGYEIYYIRDSENNFYAFGNNDAKKIIDDGSIRDVFSPVRICSEKEEELRNCPMRVWVGCNPLDLPVSPSKIKKEVNYDDNSYMWRAISIILKPNDDVTFDGGVGWPLIKLPKAEDVAITKRGEYLISLKNSKELIHGKIKDIYARDYDFALLAVFRKGASLLSQKTYDEFFKINHFILP